MKRNIATKLTTKKNINILNPVLMKAKTTEEWCGD